METLRKSAEAMGIPINEVAQEQFECYADILLEWNQRMNLTAIRDREDIAVKHFLDSLMVLRVIGLPMGAKVADIGTGAGFPGVPLKIARPDIRLTLIDSLRKRTEFLEHLSGKLGQENQVIHQRAEDCRVGSPLREQFNLVTARAVSALPVLCEYCMPYVTVGGSFLALKGPDVEDEVASAEPAIRLLGASLESIQKFTLPGGHQRSIVVIRKISQTPPKYPRASGKITKTPLG